MNRDFALNGHSIVRRFSIKALSQFVPSSVINQIALKYRNVRDRDLPVEAFLWLSVFFQLNGSLRNLTDLLSLGFHHLRRAAGLPDTWKSISKQSFSDRNVHLPWRVWRDLFHWLVDQGKPRSSRKIRLFEKTCTLKAVDATTVNLAARLQRWYGATSNHVGKAKTAMMKVLTVYNITQQIPEQIEISKGTSNEKKKFRKVLPKLGKDTLVLLDLGFWSFELFDQVCERGGYFISPLRRGTAMQSKRRVAPGNWIIQLGKFRSNKCKNPLRLVRAICPTNGKHHYYVTNILDPKQLSKEDIAETYTLRWQIELFFRDLKSLFPLRLHASRCVNGIKAHLYIALITYVLLRYLVQEAASLIGCPENRLSFRYAVTVTQTWLQMHWSMLYVNPERATRDLLESIALYCIEQPSKARVPEVCGFSP